MQKPVINASYDFLFAKLHGLWANAAKEDRLAQLINCGTEEELFRLLGEHGVDVSQRNLFHRNLLLREIHSLAGLAAQLDQQTADFYRAFYERTYFENVKVLLHYRFFPEREVAIDQLLVPIPGLPEIHAAEILKQDSTDDFLQAMQPSLYPEEIDAAVRKLADDKDIKAAESEFDKLAYRHLLIHAERTPMSVRTACTALVKLEIDIVNLCMLMRVIRTYHLDEEEVNAMWIHGGTLSPEWLSSLSGLETLSELVAKLPPMFREPLRPFTEAELYVSENTLWKLLYKQVKRYFADYNHMELSIVAFPFLRHFESLNIGRIYQGIRFGMRPRDVQDMMICS